MNVHSFKLSHRFEIFQTNKLGVGGMKKIQREKEKYYNKTYNVA